MWAIDLSNYSGALTQVQVKAIVDAQVTKVIVGLQYGFSVPGVAHQQLGALLAGGITDLEVYFESTPPAEAWDHVKQYRTIINRAWVACESNSGFEDEASIDAALAFADNLSLPKPAGIYSAGWWWGTTPLGRDYHSRPLWVANYDNTGDLTSWSKFGGWMVATMKQYWDHWTVPNLGFETDVNWYEV